MHNYDAIMVSTTSQHDECEGIKKLYKLKNQEIFDWGYTLLDDMIRDYKKASKTKKSNKRKTIMIAPSWQKDNIIDLCIDKILKPLKGKNYDVIVRPHPQHVRHQKEAFEKMKEKYAGTNIEIQTDFSNTSSVFEADVLIGDWSSIGFEYAFTTLKPVISIDSPMKVMNPEYKKVDVPPINIWGREKIGEVVSLKDLNKLDKIVEKMLKDPKKYAKQIEKFRNETIYNLGKSAEVGAEYIIETVQKQIKERKKNA
jgi:YidC/Oxa1 family membrane protein insertase